MAGILHLQRCVKKTTITTSSFGLERYGEASAVTRKCQSGMENGANEQTRCRVCRQCVGGYVRRRSGSGGRGNHIYMRRWCSLSICSNKHTPLMQGETLLLAVGAALTVATSNRANDALVGRETMRRRKVHAGHSCTRQGQRPRRSVRRATT